MNLPLGISHSSVAFTILILLPIGKDMRNSGGVGESVNILEVLLGDFERSCCDVRNIFADQFTRINGSLVDLLEQERTEGLDTRTKERAVEGHIDAPERDGGEATLESNRLRLRFCLLDTLLDNLDKVRLDVVQRHALHKCRYVNVLSLEIVEEIRETVECPKLQRN